MGIMNSDIAIAQLQEQEAICKIPNVLWLSYIVSTFNVVIS